ncbi:nicotinate (nicotinamide) nucleotide adenylyltransferase [Tychonema sp. BBK16]|uniref:nicotinate (nicotinamide) nucleotide adenylyltransferase n=1 Tax=Tychonema sp. BBK16 TaxID=2699888 RepID=UPI001EFFA0F4|nr:nicotinate (nicotinamide) nucleotide adenylyltransferase [Tychonema sp. BBK16]MCF6373439.1 nicotinate (nicotinamide) nucleotide adenylyltransferase [Tychonema sp. BBK16]
MIFFHPLALLGYSSKDPAMFLRPMWGETHKDSTRLPLCMQKVAILGGTFDPVHHGHLSIAKMAVCQFALDRVVWAVDHTPPHKSHSVLASFEQRREMVALATAGRPDFELLPLDTNGFATGAIDSLLYLQNLYPEAQLYWIIGIDAFQTLAKWPRCTEIGGLCEWLVARRETAGVEVGLVERSIDSAEEDMLVRTNHVCSVVATQMAVRGVQISWQVLTMPTIEVSSSLIRCYYSEGRAIGHLVPEAIETYMMTHQLY